MKQRQYRHLHLKPAPTRAAVKREASGQSSLPPKPAEMSWRDYLVLLLHIGAELEHCLMVEYLYAAYSLGGDQVPKDARSQQTIRRWRDLILSVAREEMGHLLSVQNLLCLLGGPVTFDRQDFPWDTVFYPFPFRLEPLTLDSLACYVFAEMPPFAELAKEIPLSKEAEFKRAAKQIWTSVTRRVPGHQTHPVGEVYERIIDLLEDSTCISDSDFQADSVRFQASWDDWGRSYQPAPQRPDGSEPRGAMHASHLIIVRMGTRTEAIAAMRAVAGQGEAPHLRADKSQQPSHFARFAEIYREFEEMHESKNRWQPARNLAVNPTTMAADYAPDDATPIEAPTTKAWANLFNLRYRILLTYLTHSYRLARDDEHPAQPGPRGAVLHKVFGEMYNLKTIAGILVDLPLGRRGSAKRAGPPFEMPYTLELPLQDVDCWRLHQDNLKSSVHLCELLLAKESGRRRVAPSSGEDYLTAMRELDRQSLEWIDQVLTGLARNRETKS